MKMKASSLAIHVLECLEEALQRGRNLRPLKNVSLGFHTRDECVSKRTAREWSP